MIHRTLNWKYICGNALLKTARGQDIVEYAMLIAIVALGAVAVLGSFQNTVNTRTGSPSVTTYPGADLKA